MVSPTSNDNNVGIILRNDSRDKSRTARSHYHKNHGSSTNKGYAFNPRISRKKWEEKNGPIETYDFKKPYTWDEFKSLPFAVQWYFLISLDRRFKITNKMLSAMFKRKSSAIMQYIGNHHSKFLATLTRNEPTTKQLEAFNEFIGLKETNTNNEIKTNISWEDFKLLPETTKINFIEYLFETYNATNTEMAKLFNIGRHTVNLFVNKYEQLSKYSIRGKRMTPEQKSWFHAMIPTLTLELIKETFVDEVDEISGDNTIELEDSTESENVETTAIMVGNSTTTEESNNSTTCIKNTKEDTTMATNTTNSLPTTQFNINLKGKIDIESLCTTLKMVIGDNPVELNITCNSTN